MTESTDPLSTGQAARLLGCSRQHIVDLCERGELRCTSIGSHRRLQRGDVEAFARRRTRGGLTRDQLRSLWLHRAVAGRIAAAPDAALELARENIRRLLERDPSRGSARWLGRWMRLIDEGPEPVMEMLTSTSEIAREMRQNSPFAGVLSETERLAVLHAFQVHAGARR